MHFDNLFQRGWGNVLSRFAGVLFIMPKSLIIKLIISFFLQKCHIALFTTVIKLIEEIFTLFRVQ